MKLISTILFSGAVAFGAAAALAQEGPAQPPGQDQAGPQGADRGGAPGGPRGGGPGGPRGGGQGAQGAPRERPAGAPERAPASEGGVVGTIDSLSPSGFVVSIAPDRKATVETADSTTYSQGKNPTSASAVKAGERVLVMGLVNVGRGNSGTTIKASQVVVRPGGSATASTAESQAFQQGGGAVVKEDGKPVATYVQGEGTIVNGAEAYRAIEAGLGAWTGGFVNRVVKLSTGEYEVHNIGVAWPHHIFIDKNFKYLGAQ